MRVNRQLNAAINLYLQMEGLSPSPKLFNRLMRGWSGFTLTGEEADEGSHEPVRSPRLMNPKSYTRPCSSELIIPSAFTLLIRRPDAMS